MLEKDNKSLRATFLSFLERAAAHLIQRDKGIPEERLHSDCKVLALHVLVPVGELGDVTLRMERPLSPTGKVRQGLLGLPWVGCDASGPTVD